MFNAMIETLKANPRKIVFTEGPDARILEATARLVEGAAGGEFITRCQTSRLLSIRSIPIPPRIV